MYGWGTTITWSLIETCKSSLNRLRKPTQSYCIAIKSSMDVLYVGTKKNLYVMFYAIVSFYMDLDTKFSTYHCFHISSEIKKKTGWFHHELNEKDLNKFSIHWCGNNMIGIDRLLRLFQYFRNYSLYPFSCVPLSKSTIFDYFIVPNIVL